MRTCRRCATHQKHTWKLAHLFTMSEASVWNICSHALPVFASCWLTRGRKNLRLILEKPLLLFKSSPLKSCFGSWKKVGRLFHKYLFFFFLFLCLCSSLPDTTDWVFFSRSKIPTFDTHWIVINMVHISGWVFRVDCTFWEQL